MKRKKIGILVGSLRRDSYSKKVAQYLAGLLDAQFDVVYPDTSGLALYNEDLENEGIPNEWQVFRNEIKALDAVLFVTPEYNRSIPAVLKNALDVASRPSGESVWGGKPGAIASVSPGKIGGFGANNHLRQVTTCLNIYMMQKPEAYIGGISGAVDDNGVSDKGMQDYLRGFAVEFAEWVNRF